MNRITFKAWLFDSRDAFEKTIRDARYKYDMPFNDFMKLYNSHRNANAAYMPEGPTRVPPLISSSNHNQLLSQNEIDDLIMHMNNGG